MDDQIDGVGNVDGTPLGLRAFCEQRMHRAALAQVSNEMLLAAKAFTIHDAIMQIVSLVFLFSSLHQVPHCMLVAKGHDFPGFVGICPGPHL